MKTNCQNNILFKAIRPYLNKKVYKYEPEERKNNDVNYSNSYFNKESDFKANYYQKIKNKEYLYTPKYIINDFYSLNSIKVFKNTINNEEKNVNNLKTHKLNKNKNIFKGINENIYKTPKKLIIELSNFSNKDNTVEINSNNSIKFSYHKSIINNKKTNYNFKNNNYIKNIYNNYLNNATNSFNNKSKTNSNFCTIISISNTPSNLSLISDIDKKSDNKHYSQNNTSSKVNNPSIIITKNETKIRKDKTKKMHEYYSHPKFKSNYNFKKLLEDNKYNKSHNKIYSMSPLIEKYNKSIQGNIEKYKSSYISSKNIKNKSLTTPLRKEKSNFQKKNNLNNIKVISINGHIKKQIFRYSCDKITFISKQKKINKLQFPLISAKKNPSERKNIIKIKLNINKKFIKNRNHINRKHVCENYLTKIPKKFCELCNKLIDSHLFKIHYNSHPSKIFNWLYLGTFANARNFDELKRNKINYILNCAIECNNSKLPKEIKEMHLKIKDEDNFELMDYFEQANKFINKCKSQRGNLLIHCKFGISRSPSVLAAYLIKYYKFTTDYALEFIKKKRNQIKPNKGFHNLLFEYEHLLNKK